MADFFNNQYRIEPARLKDFDYGSEGNYFITICTKNRVCNLGEIQEGKMIHSESGVLVEKYWKEIPDHFPHVRLYEFIVMPNHLHGIISILEQRAEARPIESKDVAVQRLYKNPSMSAISPKAGAIPTIIRSFKSVCSKEIKKTNPDFAWQSRYYDHVIRNRESFIHIQNYIYENPLKWEQDEDNPKNIHPVP